MYVYEQKPQPTDTTGVPVIISVIDSNDNYRTIGNTTSDDKGMFTYTWIPDITGTYKVIVSFAGSESYYPSSAETSFTVDPAPATPTPQPDQPQSMADLYIIPGIIGIIANSSHRGCCSSTDPKKTTINTQTKQNSLSLFLGTINALAKYVG
jgi:hypothetical protein